MAFNSRTQCLGRDIEELTRGIRRCDTNTIVTCLRRLEYDFANDHQLYDKLPVATLELLTWYLAKLFKCLDHRVVVKSDTAASLSALKEIVFGPLCTILASIANTTRRPILDLFDSETVRILADLLIHSDDPGNIHAALTVLRSKSRFQPKIIIDHNVLTILNSLVNRRQNIPVWDIVKMLNYAVKEDRLMIEAVVDAGFIPALVKWHATSDRRTEHISSGLLAYIVSDGIRNKDTSIFRDRCLPVFADLLIFSDEAHRSTLRSVSILERLLSKISDANLADCWEIWEDMVSSELIQQVAVLRERFCHQDDRIGRKIAYRTARLLDLYRGGADMEHENEVLPDIDRFVDEIYSYDANKLLKYTRLLYNASHFAAYFSAQRFVDLYALPRLVELIHRDDSDSRDITYYSTSLLATAASGTQDQLDCMIEARACPVLIRLLYSDRPETVKCAVVALMEVICRRIDLREKLIEDGLISALEHLVLNAKDDWPKQILESTSLCLSKLVMPCDFGLPQANVIMACFPLIRQLLFREADLACTTHHACWALSYIVGGTEYPIEEVTKQDVLDLLVSKVHTSDDVYCLSPTLTTLRCISQLEPQVVVDRDILSMFRSHIIRTSLEIHVIEVIWTLQNIVEDSNDRVEAVIDANLIPLIIKLLRSQRCQLQDNAVQLVAKVTSCASVDQIELLLREDLLSAVIDILIYKQNGYVILEALTILLDIVNAAKTLTHLNAIWRPLTEPELKQHITVIRDQCGEQQNEEDPSNEESIWSRATKLISELCTLSGSDCCELNEPLDANTLMSSSDGPTLLKSILILYNLFTKGALTTEQYEECCVVKRMVALLQEYEYPNEVMLQTLSILSNVMDELGDEDMLNAGYNDDEDIDDNGEFYLTLINLNYEVSSNRYYAIDNTLIILGKAAYADIWFGDGNLEREYLPFLINLADDPHVGSREETLALIGWCISRVIPPTLPITMRCLPLLKRLMLHEPRFGFIALRACESLALITDRWHKNIDPTKEILNRDLLDRLIDILNQSSTNFEYLMPVLKILEYVGVYDAKLLIDCGALPILRRLLKFSDQEVVICAVMRVMGYAVIANQVNIQSVYESGIISNIIEYIDDPNLEIAGDAVDFFLGMLAAVSNEQIIALINLCILPPLLHIQSQDTDLDGIKTKASAVFTILTRNIVDPSLCRIVERYLNI